jgi:hypothetical protein
MKFSSNAVGKFSGPLEVERTTWRGWKKYLLVCSVANSNIPNQGNDWFV